MKRYLRAVWGEITAANTLFWRSVGRVLLMAPTRRHEMDMCWHHDRKTGTSWIHDHLVDFGRDKIFICSHCKEIWLFSQLARKSRTTASR